MIALLQYCIFRLLLGFLALLPFSFLVLITKPLYWLLYRVFRYRRKVVDDNLRLAFPDQSNAERAQLAQGFYRNLAEVAVETVKGWTLSKAAMQNRYRFRNAAVFESLYQEGRSAIIVGGHFGNWEWGSLSFPLWVSATVVGIYKPINNPYIEKYLQKIRCRWGLQLTPMAQTGRALVQYRKQASLFVLIADQSPSNLEAAHWLPFFHRETPFLNGMDKIARRSNYPVYYFDIHRVGRGQYEIEFQLLCEQPALEAEGALTARFRDALEVSIRRQPEIWLWSHRRWKRAR